MRKVWVVVANKSESKIYHAKDVNTLVEIHSLTHGESRLHNHDMVSDGPGKLGRKGRYGLDVVEEKVTAQDKEALLFAHQIAKILDEGCQKADYERLYIVAKAPFLGILRECLSANVVKVLESEIHKDVVFASPKEIREYLPPVL